MVSRAELTLRARVGHPLGEPAGFAPSVDHSAWLGYPRVLGIDGTLIPCREGAPLPNLQARICGPRSIRFPSGFGLKPNMWSVFPVLDLYARPLYFAKDNWLVPLIDVDVRYLNYRRRGGADGRVTARNPTLGLKGHSHLLSRISSAASWECCLCDAIN